MPNRCGLREPIASRLGDAASGRPKSSHWYPHATKRLPSRPAIHVTRIFGVQDNRVVADPFDAAVSRPLPHRFVAALVLSTKTDQVHVRDYSKGESGRIPNHLSLGGLFCERKNTEHGVPNTVGTALFGRSSRRLLWVFKT